ncbi:MAG TPA: bacillithiol biosynthesis cysteine-adding enzyme BshC [Gemmatimonadaceae bacterium]
MTEPVVLTRRLGGALGRGLVDGTLPGEWYARPPRSRGEWSAHVERVRSDLARHDWYGALAPALQASGAAAARLERVAGGRGVVVTTGQQPGLFGGPIYTWSKALSAIALAEVVERETGIPAAPVFWAATYDADFAEASASYVALGDRVERLQMPPTEHPGRSMRDTPLGDVSPLHDALERAAGSAADPGLLALVKGAYAPTETVGGAFVSLLRAVLEPLGMAVLDAGHPAVIEAERPLVRMALSDADAVDAAVQRRDAELREAGYTPRVAHVNGLTLVFEGGADGRRRIPIAGARAVAARADAAALEPNVLLRPVAERSILPTVAYLAGPGELEYFAQASAVAAALGAAMPLALPRWSGLIIEPHVQRILRRYALEPDDLSDPHAALTRLARERLPDPVRDALARARAALDASVAELARATEATEPPLVPASVLDGAMHAVGRRLDRLERRITAAVKRRHETVVRDVETARAALFPLGHPQERMLTIVPLLARHGTPLLDLMLDRAREHATALAAASSDEALAAHGHVGDGR